MFHIQLTNGRANMCNTIVTTTKIKYPAFVNQSQIKQQGSNGYRFLLKIPFNGSFTKSELVVILKNPSAANTINCDRTISKVCNTAHYNGYSGVIILNLFPFRATNATHVQTFYALSNYNSIMNVNLRIIQKTCLSHDVVFAWGTDTIKGTGVFSNYYNNAIQNITSTITTRTFYALRCNCNKICSAPHHSLIRYPLHGLRWCNRSSLYKY